MSRCLPPAVVMLRVVVMALLEKGSQKLRGLMLGRLLSSSVVASLPR
jgi:hypothetical protein